MEQTKLASIKEEAESYICGLRMIQPKIINGPDRRRDLVLARFDIWFYLRYRYRLTYKVIGYLYSRHYSTIMHGVEVAEPADVELGITGE